MKTFVSRRPAQTLAVGRRVAKNVPIPSILALKGDLGSGKTQFVKGLASALGIKAVVISPTFLLRKDYRFQYGSRSARLVHLDLYRLKTPDDLKSVDLEEIAGGRNSLLAIEWPRLIAKNKLPRTFCLYFTYGKHPQERKIRIPDRLLKRA